MTQFGEIPLLWDSLHFRGLYIRQEINPKWLQMKKCFFMKNRGWDQKLEVKGYVLVQKVQFLKKVWKKDYQCTSIFHFADRPELPYEVDFWRNSCPSQNICSEKLTFFGFLGRFFVCSNILRWVCKDFGLESKRKMLPGSQLSFLSNQIN